MIVGKDSSSGYRGNGAQCRVIGGSGRMDALSDYICKSNELVDKMVRILLYIQRTGIRKGSKDQDLGGGGRGKKKGEGKKDEGTNRSNELAFP